MSAALFGVFAWVPPFEDRIPATRQERRRFKPRGTRREGRKHRPIEVGDIHGPYRVIALLERDATSNERVRVACNQGHERDVYVFNLRTIRHCLECRRSAR